MDNFHFQIPVASFFDCLGNITQLIFLPPLNEFSASQIFTSWIFTRKTFACSCFRTKEVKCKNDNENLILNLKYLGLNQGTSRGFSNPLVK